MRTLARLVTVAVVATLWAATASVAHADTAPPGLDPAPPSPTQPYACQRSFTIENVHEVEGNPGRGNLMLVFAVTSHGCARATELCYRTRDLTAKSGTDYVAAEGILTFPAGDLSDRYVRVVGTPDVLPERGEGFALELNEVVGLDVQPRAEATGTIVNDDAGQVVDEVTDPDAVLPIGVHCSR